MSALENRAVDLLNKLEALTTQYAPDVLDAAQTAVSVSAAGSLLTGLLSLGFAALAWYLSSLFAMYCQRKEKEDRWAMWDFPKAMAFIIGIGTSSLIAIFSVSNLFDIWNWVALFNPKLALAHKILGL